MVNFLYQYTDTYLLFERIEETILFTKGQALSRLPGKKNPRYAIILK